MSTFLKLVKTQINLNFGISALKYKFLVEKKQRWQLVVIPIAILFGIAPLLILYTFMMLGLFKAGVMFGKPEITLTVGFLIGMIMVLVFGIFYVMSTFYFSKDMEFLISLPMKPWKVLGSKFITVMLNEYLTLIPMLLPVLLIYGIGTHQELIFWLKGLIILLFAPILPLTLSSIFLLILMRYVNFKRSKDFFAVIGGFLGLGIALSINFFAAKIPKGDEQQFFNSLFETQAGLVNFIGSKFPPSIWATKALSQNGIISLGNMGLFLGISLALLLLLLWIGNNIFYKSILSGHEVMRKRKTLSKSEMDSKIKGISSPTKAIFYKELKMLLRTPIYALNGLAGIIVLPLMLFSILLVPSSSEEADVKMLIDFVTNPSNASLITLIGIGVALLTGGLNMVASTSISREGTNFWISKMIPVTPEEQVMGKFWNGFWPAAICAVFTVVAFGIFGRLSALRIIIMLSYSLIGSGLFTFASMIPDILKPKLIWNTPQEAIKQNMNAIISMGIAFILTAILATIVIGMILLGAAEWLFTITLGVILVGGIIAIKKLVIIIANKSFAKLEM